jgi:hypothetical protein
MITAEALSAALPHVLAAPRDDAEITDLCLRPGYGQRHHPAKLTLTRSMGIPGERWTTAPWMRLPDGSPDPRIQISILPQRMMDLVWKPGDVEPHPGDPIVADMNMSLEHLPTGSLIRAGSALLRVSDLWNDACVKWKTRYGVAAFEFVRCAPELRLRGVLCEIVEDGEVTRADRLRVVR